MSSASTPVAGRLRRPTWRDPRLLIGLLLVALSVVAVAMIVRSADQTVPYYSAKDTLTPGTVLTEADVVITSVRVGKGQYIEAGGEEPWGRVVTRTVGDGELIPAAALAEREDFDGRPVAVQSHLPLAQDIVRGALVDVWLTRETDADPTSELVAGGLVVDQVEREGGAFSVAGGETVYVVVPNGTIAAFLDALAAEGEISVVGLGGGDPT